MSDIKIDDRALDAASQLIKKFTQKQKEIMNNYYREIRALEEYWEEAPFESLLNKIQNVVRNTEKSSESIEQRYPMFYIRKAEMVRNRPSFSGSSNVRTSISSSTTSSKKGTGAKSRIDEVFEKYNKKFRDNLYFYLRKINLNFNNPNEMTSFYDPDGISKRGLYKNIMNLNTNSQTFHDDLLSLTGQHVYFQLQNIQKTQVARCLYNEMNAVAWKNDIEFVKFTEQIINGNGINHKYLKFSNDNEKNAFNFFSQAFKATLSNDIETVNKYNKYYSTTYGHFSEIMKSLNY